MPEVGFDIPLKINEKQLEKKLLFTPLDEINKDETGQIRFIEGLNGQIAFSSSKGWRYKNFNEDLQYLNTWSNFFASIDGMGGVGKEGSGKKAAYILAEEIKKGLNIGKSIKNIHLNAYQQMKNSNLKEGGVCFLMAQIKGNVLETYRAGDVRAIVIKKNGKVYETKDECLSYPKNVVYNCLQADNLGELTTNRFPLELGDRIVIASDGVWDNFYHIYGQNNPQKESTQNLAELIRKQPIRAAANLITNWIKVKMSSQEGKPDNYNFIIYDFIKPTRGNLNVQNAQNIREVLLALDKSKGIHGSKQFFPPEALKIIIKKFFQGEFSKNHLTRSEGFREKILQLA